MRTSLRDYFHSLNVLNEDTDVYVDGTDDGCAVVPSIKLTQKGEKEWGSLLDHPDLYVDVEEYGNCIMCDNDEAYDLYEEKGVGIISDAIYLIYALAGYCSSSKFDEWFGGADAKPI